MSSEVWKARERICGRPILIDFDPESGAISTPELCPECGARVSGVDVIGPAEAMPSGSVLAPVNPVDPTIERPEITVAAPAIVLVTVAALELAAEESIGIRSIQGTGYEGAITKADVLAAIAARTPPERSGEK